MECEALKSFLDEAKTLSRRNIWLKLGKRFISLMYKYAETEHHEYIYARVEISTGDIYSQSGKKPAGNIYGQYGGKEVIDAYGVIVNAQKLKKRMNELASKE